MRRLGIAAVFLALLLAPEASQACPVCFSASDENRMAFLITAIFMTALPLTMIGGVVSWFTWRARKLREKERAPERRERQLALR